MWVQGDGAGSNGPRGAEELNHHGLLAANFGTGHFLKHNLILSPPQWLAGAGH